MVDPHLDDAHRELAERYRAFGEDHLRAVARHEEDPTEQAREIGARLGEAGLLDPAVPPPFGRATARGVLVARERLAYFSLLAEMVFSAQALAAWLIEAAGSELQCHRWLGPLASGEVLGAVGLSEPEAGTDLGAARTTAEGDGALWRLSGLKSWVTGGASAGVYVVTAREPGSEGPRGLSLFLVDGEVPGVTVHPIEPTAALPVAEVRLAGAPAVRLGEAGAALDLVTRGWEALRPGAAGAACGLATRALDETVRHAQARRQFGHAIAALPTTRMALADMHAAIEAARRLARHAAWLTDAGAEEAPRAAAAARLVATEAAERAVERAVEVHGSQGLVRGSTVERLFREARALRLREGTTDLVRLDLADAILKESR
jgi:acyl-CoA dehydrogenase